MPSFKLLFDQNSLIFHLISFRCYITASCIDYLAQHGHLKAYSCFNQSKNSTSAMKLLSFISWAVAGNVVTSFAYGCRKILKSCVRATI